MPLTNFGAILNFAETVERDDMEFYRNASDSAAASAYRDLFDAFAAEDKKNIAVVQRTRRENVTEMILEPIHNFSRGDYQLGMLDLQDMDNDAILAAAAAIEDRALRYYTDAAAKIRALPEVSRSLKMLAKKRDKRIEKLKNSQRSSG